MTVCRIDKQTDKDTNKEINKETPLKTSASLRNATPADYDQYLTCKHNCN